MLHVVTFLWKPPQGYRSKFTGAHVDALRRMVRRHYPGPHTFHCVTDDARGISEPDVKLWQLWPDFAHIRNPSGAKNPSCYRRLRLFARTTQRWLGDRFVCLDLDCVILKDMRPLWDRTEDFVIWKSSTNGNPYNGSMFMHRAGTREEVWMNFDPDRTPSATRAAGFYGSDQAWLALCLGPNEATWGSADGVLSFRSDLNYGARPLPPDARIVFFHGKGDPWESQAQRIPWVKENWR